MMIRSILVLLICLGTSIALFQNCGPSSGTLQNDSQAQFVDQSSTEAAIQSAEKAKRSLADQNELLPHQDSCPFGDKELPNQAVTTAYQNGTVSESENCVSEERVCQNGELSGTYRYSFCVKSSAKACVFNGMSLKSGQTVMGYQEVIVGSQKSCQQKTLTCHNGNLAGALDYPLASCDPSESKKSCLFDGVQIVHGERVIGYKISESPNAAQKSCDHLEMVCDNGNIAGANVFARSSCPFSETKKMVSLSSAQQTSQVQGGGGKNCLVEGKTYADGEWISLYKLQTVGSDVSCDLVKVMSLCRDGNLSVPLDPRSGPNGTVGDKLYGSCRVAASNDECSLPGFPNWWRDKQTYKSGQKVRAYSVTKNRECDPYMKQLTCKNGWFGLDAITYRTSFCDSSADSPSLDSNDAYKEAQNQAPGNANRATASATSTPTPVPTKAATPTQAPAPSKSPAPASSTVPAGAGVTKNSQGEIIGTNHVIENTIDQSKDKNANPATKSAEGARSAGRSEQTVPKQVDSKSKDKKKP